MHATVRRNEGVVGKERQRPLAESAVSAVPSSADAPEGLDWQAFAVTYFPGRRRHDLEALTAYGAYRRSRPLDQRQSRQVTRREEAKSGEARSTGLPDWEYEGGAIRWGTTWVGPEVDREKVDRSRQNDRLLARIQEVGRIASRE